VDGMGVGMGVDRWKDGIEVSSGAHIDVCVVWYRIDGGSYLVGWYDFVFFLRIEIGYPEIHT
jgi:hypothetical protein